MSQKLCWKCRDFYEKKFGLSYWTAPASHCHHDEPEEKPKCWCEREGEKRMQVQDYWIDQWKLGHYQMRAVEIAQFCPYCGKKLKEEKPKCICERYILDSISAYTTLVENQSCTNNQIALQNNYCPECGRKLGAK